MDPIQRLKTDYPWIQTPLIVGAPMRLIALADLAVEISRAGGIGFIGAGTDVSDLETHLQSAQSLLQKSPSLPSTNNSTLPIGVGFINWGASLPDAIPLIGKYKPAAVWFFAPSSLESLSEWTRESRRVSPETKIWVQVGSVKQAVEALSVEPEVLVVQGQDAGGHGLVQGAGLISLVPEIADALFHSFTKTSKPSPILLAAGGISESRSAAAALTLGASGIIMGTRFLASNEANIAPGYQAEVLRASDGGQTTVRTKVYDNLRGTTGWADTHNARGVINRSFVDAVAGMSDDENKRLYELEEGKGDRGWGVEARMTTYAGAGVGLVKNVRPAGEIVKEVREGVSEVLGKLRL